MRSSFWRTHSLAVFVVLTLPSCGESDSPPAAAGSITSPIAELDPLIDPSRRDDARRVSAENPLGASGRDRANRLLAQFGLTSSDRFEVISAHTDDLGTTHARLQQFHENLRVVGAQVLSHTLATGQAAPFDVSVVTGITAAKAPRLSADDAVRIVEGDARHREPWVISPKTELVYLPSKQWTLASSGLAVPPPRFDPLHENAVPEEVDGSDVTVRYVGTRLAWEVITSEGDTARRRYLSQRWHVDARTGEIVHVHDLDDAVTGTGYPRWTADLGTVVTFQTKNQGSCYRMEDTGRKFATEDEDNGAGHPVNCDANNVWGNGVPFAGDANASNTGRQTAMVDTHYNATVYWELMDDVFTLQGPDDNYYSVNAFVHDQDEWDDAMYHSLSGNVSFGDGSELPPPFEKERTNLDCVGHELGHAFNDHQVGWDDDTDCLNESLGDIFGEWTEVYQRSGNYAGNVANVGPGSFASWKNECSGRGMISGGPPFYYASIGDTEEHTGSRPSTHAFTRLARGSSPFLRNPSFSPKIPWGMRGIGLETAARIYFRAAMAYVIPGLGYPGLRTAMQQQATSAYGATSVNTREVQNAYASINVGNVASNYPTLPPTIPEQEANQPHTSPQSLTLTTPPATVVGVAPRKAHVSGHGGDDDWFRVVISQNEAVTVRVSPAGLGAYNVRVADGAGSALIGANGPLQVSNAAVEVTTLSTLACATSSCVILVRVQALSGQDYILDLDREPVGSF